MLTKVCGTPEYTAPEMIQKKKYGTSVDMWFVAIPCFCTIHSSNSLLAFFEQVFWSHSLHLTEWISAFPG